MRIDHAKTVQIVKLLAEGCGICAVSRLTGCHTHTVLGVLSQVGTACESLHDGLLRNVVTDSVQVDELWSRVGVRQSRVREFELNAATFTHSLASRPATN